MNGRLQNVAAWAVSIVLIGPGMGRAGADSGNLVKNGSFSNGLGDWTAAGNGEIGTNDQKHCLPAQSGNPFLSFNVYWGRDANVRQSIALPDEPLSLSFRTWGNLDPVEAIVSIIDAEGVEHVLDTFTPPITEWSEDPFDSSKPILCTGATDVSKSYDLSEFKGQTVALQLRARTTGPPWTNGTFASFDDVKIPYSRSSLETSVVSSQDEVFLGVPFDLRFKVHNTGTTDLADVLLFLGIAEGSEGSVQFDQRVFDLTDLPADYSHVRLTESILPIQLGPLGITALAKGTDPDGQSIQSPEVSTPTEVKSPFRLSKLTCTTEADQRIVPGDYIEIDAEVEQLDETGVGKLKITLSGDLIDRANETTFKEIPAAAGKFVVPKIGAVIVNETNAEIMSRLLTNKEEIPLDSHIKVKFEWSAHDRTFTVEEKEKASLKDANGEIWKIRYPDYSTLTGDPVAPAGEEAYSAEAFQYFAKGNENVLQLGEKTKYYDEPLVRKWALAAARLEAADECAPDGARLAAGSIAWFLAERLGSDSDRGTALFVMELVAALEVGQALPKAPCNGQAFNLGALCRTVGLRVREMDIAAQYSPGSMWWQHSTNQIWYDGRWNYYDVFYDAPEISEASGWSFVTFYFTDGRFRERYNFLNCYYSVRALSLDGFGLKGDGTEGEPLTYGKPDSCWRLVGKYAKPGIPLGQGRTMATYYIQASSPITMLYVDDHGRRIGAAGPLTEADYLPPEAADASGGGSVCEVPGGCYIPPHMPVRFDSYNQAAVNYAREMIAIPEAELTGRFSVTLTGTGEGPFEVRIYRVAEGQAGEALYAHSGQTAAGQKERIDLTVDRTAPDAPTMTGQVTELPDRQTPPGCGGCGSGSAMLLPLLLMRPAARLARRRPRYR